MTHNPAGLPLHPAAITCGRHEAAEDKDARIENMLCISQDFRNKEESERKKAEAETIARAIARLKLSHRLIAWMLQRYTKFRVVRVVGKEIGYIRETA